mgnify:CR=1 FL=1
MNKKVLAAVLSSAIFCGTMQASASSNFFADVPADDWSYTAVNDLIKTGHITSYTQTIPEGRIMSRLEMAMIVDEAMGNLGAFTPKEQETLKKLNEEYFFDIKKVRLINKINATDEEALNQEPQQQQQESDFTPEEKSKALSQQPCKYCGTMILQIPGRKEKKFCSDDCRNSWWNKHLTEVKRKNMTDYICPACGKTFSAYGKRNRKYCSHECYITDRFGGVACR